MDSPGGFRDLQLIRLDGSGQRVGKVGAAPTVKAWTVLKWRGRVIAGVGGRFVCFALKVTYSQVCADGEET